MRPVALRIALILSVLATAPAAALAAAAASAAEAGQSDADSLFDQYTEDLYAGRFAEALEAARKIRVDRDNPEGQAIVLAMRASALLGLDRDAEAMKLLAEAERLAPDSPHPTTLIWLGGLLSDRLDVAADSIDRLIAKFPDEVRELDWEHVAFFLRNEPKGQERRNEDRRIALAQLGFGGDTERGHYLAAEAVELLVKRGDVAAAAKLLPNVKLPRSIENMLIRKRFSALWPQLEEMAGPNLTKITEASVAAADKVYKAAPDDPFALQNLIDALRRAGRYEEATILGSKLPRTSVAMASADEQTGWAVNNLALALYEGGRPEEADELYALLNDAPMKDGGWRVSMIINRLELLVSSGRFDKASQLLGVTEESAKTNGNDYARQLVRRLKYCTLSRTGRAADAAKLLPEVLDHADDAPGPTIDGLLCAGEVAKAEEVALQALKKEEFEEDFVRRLQARPLTSDDPSVWQGKWAELRARPAIAREFDRLGRDMPEALLPRSSR